MDLDFDCPELDVLMPLDQVPDICEDGLYRQWSLTDSSVRAVHPSGRTSQILMLPARS